ncbi:MAG: hypothetical protein B6I38_10660 [Anaerolineaceae bacterium 4572_5.1]|nr:MAG: hypothetical protein B6I38_10660 [Anaerolineaceae bacterium 4572_5.1]
MKNKVPLLDLVAQYKTIKPEINSAIQKILDSGQFILGKEVELLENEIAHYLSVKHGIGVASGTDALILAMQALGIGPGDEVILPTYTFFATMGAVLHVGAVPVLIDIDPQTYCLDVNKLKEAITSTTRAIIPVHLYGHPADMNPILEIAKDNDIKIIEDNAQAFGAEYNGKKTGSFGDIACLSFFPSKNLGGYGDGGMIVTNSQELAEKIRMLRVHGWNKKYYPEVLGYNSRLDALQATVLRVKLQHIDEWNSSRRNLAANYTHKLAPIPGIGTPYENDAVKHVYHLYVIQTENRIQVQNKLKKAGVSSGIYYPQPLHLSKPWQALGHQTPNFPVAQKASQELLAIPIYPEMTPTQVGIILSALQGSK